MPVHLQVGSCKSVQFARVKLDAVTVTYDIVFLLHAPVLFLNAKLICCMSCGDNTALPCRITVCCITQSHVVSKCNAHFLSASFRPLLQ